MKTFFAIPCLVVAALVLAACLGLRYNVTASMPAGIYRLSGGAPTRGDLAEFSFPPDCPFGVLARSRGYLKPSSSLLKRVAAIAGDLVEVDAHGVSVNGVMQPQSRILEADSKGRPNTSALQTGRVPQGQALILAAYAKSFDGRYFGYVSVDRLRRVTPVFTFNQEDRHDQ